MTLLGVLSGHPVTIAELCDQTGLPRRTVESELEELRLAGEPIVADSAGVRLTADPDELARYVEGRRRRAAQIHRGTLALRTTLRRMRAPVEGLFW